MKEERERPAILVIFPDITPIPWKEMNTYLVVEPHYDSAKRSSLILKILKISAVQLAQLLYAIEKS